MFAVNLTPTADAARVQNRRAALWGNKAIINQNQTPWRQTWIQMSHDPGAALLVYCPDYSHETRSQNMNENHTVISQECPDFYKLRDIIQPIVIYAKWVIGAERSCWTHDLCVCDRSPRRCWRENYKCEKHLIGDYFRLTTDVRFRGRGSDWYHRSMQKCFIYFQQIDRLRSDSRLYILAFLFLVDHFSHIGIFVFFDLVLFSSYFSPSQSAGDRGHCTQPPAVIIECIRTESCASNFWIRSGFLLVCLWFNTSRPQCRISLMLLEFFGERCRYKLMLLFRKL